MSLNLQRGHFMQILEGSIIKKRISELKLQDIRKRIMTNEKDTGRKFKVHKESDKNQE